MGNFYVNHAVIGAKQADVVGVLAKAKRAAWVGPTVKDITLVYDQQADAQDEQAIDAVGVLLSRGLGGSALAMLNHDDDILAYWLHRDGAAVDQYNSCPGYFGDGETTPTGGDAALLARTFAAAGKAGDIESVLRGDQYVFALERHQALAELLALPWPHACLGFAYLDQGQLPPGLAADQFVAVGQAGR